MENQRELTSKAFSAIEMKELGGGKRRFSGVATTPATDRIGDSVNPLGVKFMNPLVLLHQHNRLEPIGKVWFDAPTAKGIKFEAEIPEIDEPPTLKERVEVALGEIRHGLVRFVSIGFKPLKYAFTDEGVDYQETEVFELSLVSIPALSEAVITSIKSMQPLTADVVKLLRDADRRGIKLISARDLHLQRGAVAITHRR
jgi:uncharacterized protein